jgi:hypothetical protein
MFTSTSLHGTTFVLTVGNRNLSFNITLSSNSDAAAGTFVVSEQINLLTDASGNATDQGRRALVALERGDVRSYRAALQDAEARMAREQARTTRDRERDTARAQRDAERAQRETEREQRATDRERTRADKERQDLDDLVQGYQRGERGLTFEQQRRLIRAGRGRVNGDRFEAKADTSHTPPRAVQAAARRSLRLRAAAAPSNRGMTPVGLARARDLANGRALSTATVRQMRAFFARHDKTRPDGDVAGSKWEQAWLGWGGDAGWRWSRGVLAGKARLSLRQRRLLKRTARGEGPPRMGRLISRGLVRERGPGFAVTEAGMEAIKLELDLLELDHD